MPECPVCGETAEERTEIVHVGNNPAWPVVEQRFWSCADCNESWLDQEQAQAYADAAREAGFVYFADGIVNQNQLNWAASEVERIQAMRAPDVYDLRRLEYLLDALKRYQGAA